MIMMKRRANLLAPPTLVALTMIMAVGAGAPGAVAPIQTRTGDAEREQVAQLLAAVKQAAKTLHGRSVDHAVVAAAANSTIAAPINAPIRRMDAVDPYAVSSPFTPYLLDLPPPARDHV